MPRKPIVTVLALMLALSACSQATKPGVKMRSLSTDIGLGVIHPKADTSSGPAVPPVNIGPGFQPPPIITPPPLPVCPTAGLFTFAAPVQQDFVGKPAAGAYKWRYRLSADKAADLTTLFGYAPLDDYLQPVKGKVSLERFGTRSVTLQADVVEPAVKGTVKQLSPDAYDQFNKGAFAYLQTELPPYGFPSMGPTPLSFNRSDTIRVQPASYATRPEAPSDQGKGLQLELSAFAEGNPAKPQEGKSWLMADAPLPNFFPTPASIGNIVRWGFAAQSVNPLALAAPQLLLGMVGAVPPSDDEIALIQQMGTPGPKVANAFTGQIDGIQTIDACGELVDAYLVKGTLVVTRDDTVYTFDYSYGVAPQMGGMVVYQRLAYPAARASVTLRDPDKELLPSVKPTVVYEASIADLTPAGS